MAKYTFFRYPGGKNKLLGKIIPLIEPELLKYTKFIEPFFGGGSFGLYVLTNFPNIKEFIFSDLDSDLVNLWNSVIQCPEDLIKLIKQYKPSVDSFFSFTEDLNNKEYQDIVDSGFKKLAIHQMSYSGLGCKAGGPIGGLKQESKYKIDCRWSPIYLEKSIKKIHDLFKFRNVKGVYNVDYRVLLNEFKNIKDVFIYLDPPYFDKGNDLYINGFSIEDHKNLHNILKQIKGSWSLSYDKNYFIEDLYRDIATITTLEVNYSITNSRKKEEVLFIKD